MRLLVLFGFTLRLAKDTMNKTTITRIMRYIHSTMPNAKSTLSIDGKPVELKDKPKVSYSTIWAKTITYSKDILVLAAVLSMLYTLAKWLYTLVL